MQAVGTERRGLPVLAGGRHRKACPAGVDCPACRRLATAPRGSPSRWSADATLLLPETTTRRKNGDKKNVVTQRRHPRPSYRLPVGVLASNCYHLFRKVTPTPTGKQTFIVQTNSLQVTGYRFQVTGSRILPLWLVSVAVLSHRCRCSYVVQLN